MAEIEAVEKQLIENANEDTFVVDGLCVPCNKTVPLLVDKLCGAQQINNVWIPNWRERLVCPLCQMNNRQRLMATLIKQELEQKHNAKIYFMEQVTPIYHWAMATFPQHDIIGSEYLGYEYHGGQKVNGIRHEDVMNLSFNDNSLNMIISNDVFEHVPNPKKGFAECARVLRQGGFMLATMTFHREYNDSVVRAELVANKLNHLHPPVFHGNPVSTEGSLVFTDFGWDILSEIKAFGFSDVVIEVYANRQYGHLGSGQLVFKMKK